jgi:hypothetical protein
VLRRVDDVLKQEQGTRQAKERGIAVHGNRIVLHLVFKSLGSRLFEEPATDKVGAEISKIPDITRDRLNKVTAEVLKNYSGSYPANIFKNTTKCTAIVKEIG